MSEGDQGGHGPSRPSNDLANTLLSSLKHLGEGLAVLDVRSGRLLYVNPAVSKITGHSEEELLGLPTVLELVPPDKRDEAKARLKRREGDPSSETYDFELLRRDGSVVPVEISSNRALEGPQIVLVRDATERKRIESFKNRFIADAAHELRTPLASITGFSELLAEDWRRMEPEQVDDALERVRGQGQHLRTLVNNLLDLTRLEEGRLDIRLQPFPLADLVRGALQDVPAPEGKDVAVDVEPHLSVLADPMRVGQVLVNLLVNAYNYGGNRIKLWARAKADEVELRISDNGGGIPKEYRDTIFQPFIRGPNSVNSSGSGLGLTIVRTLIEACGGRVEYEQGDPGASFVVTLQAATA